MTTYKITCRCAVHREREHSFYVDREPTLQEAREWLVNKIGVYADTTFVHVHQLKVESI